MTANLKESMWKAVTASKLLWRYGLDVFSMRKWIQVKPCVIYLPCVLYVVLYFWFTYIERNNSYRAFLCRFHSQATSDPSTNTLATIWSHNCHTNLHGLQPVERGSCFVQQSIETAIACVRLHGISLTASSQIATKRSIISGFFRKVSSRV